MDERSTTMVFSDGLLTCTQTASESVYDVTVTINATLNGDMLAYTAHADQATPTTDIITGLTFDRLTAGEACMFVWGLAATANMVVAQGPIVHAADVTNGVIGLEYPPISDQFVPTNTLVMSLSTAATANAFGTSNWNATGVTLNTTAAVVPAVSTLPSRPLTSLT